MNEDRNRSVPKVYGYLLAVLVLPAMVVMFGLWILDNDPQGHKWLERRRMARFLACAPKKPLPPEELFASAMRDYWHHRMRVLWTRDRYLTEEHQLSWPLDLANETCDLTPTWWGRPQRPGHDACYPWKLSGYTTLDALRERLAQFPDYRRGLPRTVVVVRAGQRPKKGSNFFVMLARDFLHGEVNRPDTEALHTKTHYNTDADFSVLHNIGDRQLWYPHDCCRLMTYDEAMNEMKREELVFTQSDFSEKFPPDKQMQTAIFLRVKYYKLDYWWPTLHPQYSSLEIGRIEHDQPSFRYYAVSPCGKIHYTFSDR